MKRLLLLFFIAAVQLSAYGQTGNVGIGTTLPGSKLTVNGSFAAPYKIVTATATVGANDFYTAYNGAANGTLTLPAATAAAPAAGNILGRVYHFKNTGTTVLTVAAAGAELLDNQSGAGVASITLNPGYYAMIISKGTTSGTTWEVALIVNSNPPVVYEAIGTTTVNIASGSTADLPGATVTFTTTSASTTVLVTYSALGLPLNGAAPTQGSIDLVVDGVKQISSYYSGADAPSALARLGNYSTAQKMIVLAAGSHTIKLQAKCWFNTTVFNTDPVAAAYGGALASDASAMKARISVLVTAN
jgi:hypothetical protein